MIEYNNILIFKYKGKIYNYYLDDKNRKFFTCINSNGDEEYIDMQRARQQKKQRIFSKGLDRLSREPQNSQFAIRNSQFAIRRELALA